MKHILITGATGNIGFEFIKFLMENDTPNRVIAGVRDIDKAKKIFHKYKKLDYVYFNFEYIESVDHAIENIDTVFLLRPPHISNVDKYFRPLIIKLK